ncbi:hypothetical protein HY256_11090 [Candidatus Sumerlaeota bacterium]|nr:hypothetical protein [Candidatus Sumerlaeota bacterium]
MKIIVEKAVQTDPAEHKIHRLKRINPELESRQDTGLQLDPKREGMFTAIVPIIIVSDDAPCLVSA